MPIKFWNPFQNETLRHIVKRIFAVKTLNDFEEDRDHQSFTRTLTALDLTLIGIGAIIGTGIFVLTGTAAALYAGPAIVLSFIISGIVAGLAALCYAEMASMIPISGSAYSYTYATMGELSAWIIGWDLILEYLVGAATVAVGWSGYVASFFKSCGVYVDPRYVNPPIGFDAATNRLISSGNYFNFPAFVIVLSITAFLLFGIRKTAILNTIAVIIKLIVIMIFIGTAIPKVNPQNWNPFVPPPKNGQYGALGVFRGATLVFFAYIGFDAISTTAQECKNPQRDLPRGIFFSLSICTVLYVIVSLLLTGVVPFTQLDVPHPVAYAAETTGMKFMVIIIEIGAVAGLTSVLLIMLMGQPRIFCAMAHDGLLPARFAKLHERFNTPWAATIMTGSLCAILAALFPIEVLGELTSVGTLFAFFLVSVAVPILRYKRPNAQRLFKVPGGPFLIPGLSAIFCLILIFISQWTTIVRLFVWMAIGLIVYACYGYRRSTMRGKLLIQEQFSPVAIKPEDKSDDFYDSFDLSVGGEVETKVSYEMESMTPEAAAEEEFYDCCEDPVVLSTD